MKPTKTHRLVIAIASAYTLSLACGWEEPPDIEHHQQPIATEIPGSVERISNFYDDPDLALASYAMGGISGCSATMIGPNTLMTASHCGASRDGNPFGVCFFAYEASDISQKEYECFDDCQYLVHTFPNTDLTIAYCPPNSDGESPGDKYGYLDFDPSVPQLGQSMESIWINPIDDVGGGRHLLYSSGQVTRINTANHWSNESMVALGGSNGCNDSSFPNYWEFAHVTESSVYAFPGASGSPVLNPANGDIILGPTSTGPENGGTPRAQLPITYYLSEATAPWQQTTSGCNKSWLGSVNQSQVASFGLSSSAYYGNLDKNNNQLFDVQEDMEEVIGENTRDYYSLWFDSPRQNQLWTLYPGGSINRAAEWAALIRHSGAHSQWQTMLGHDDLDLRSGVDYRLTATLTKHGQDSAWPPYMRFCLQSGSLQNCSTFYTTATDAWQRISARIPSPGPNPQLQVQMWGLGHMRLLGLNVIEDGAVIDFDSHDKRKLWKRAGTGQRSLIRPDGTGSGIDWAGVAARDPSEPYYDDWGLRSFQLALVGNETTRVCFEARRDPSAPLPFGYYGRVRVMNGGGTGVGTQLVHLYFSPSDNWQRFCTGYFTPPDGHNNLYFGIYANTSQSVGGIVIDDIEFEYQ